MSGEWLTFAGLSAASFLPWGLSGQFSCLEKGEHVYSRRRGRNGGAHGRPFRKTFKGLERGLSALKALEILLEDWGPILRTHMVAHNDLWVQ